MTGNEDSGRRYDKIKRRGGSHAEASCTRSRDGPARRRLAASLTTSPASAQFYKDKTLTLLVNYAAGGNADTEARVFQRHLSQLHPRRADRHHPQRGGRRRRQCDEPARPRHRRQAGRTDARLLHHERDLVDHRRSGAQDEDPGRLHADRRRPRLERGLCAQGHRARRLHQARRLRERHQHFRRRLQPRHLARHAAAARARDHGQALHDGHRLPGHRRISTRRCCRTRSISPAARCRASRPR